MKGLYLIAFLLLSLISCPIIIFGQFLSNPSFEGTAAMSVPPPSWYSCGEYSTPDTQPINIGWNFSKAASDGNTYLGLVMRGSIGSVNDNLAEAGGTQLIQPLTKNSCYTFTIDLATFLGAQFNTGFDLVQYNNPGHLEIWASKTSCGKDKLLWKSPLISNEEWRTFSFQVSLTDTYQYLILEAQYANPNNKLYGNILLDNFKIADEENTINLGEDRVICEGTEVQLSIPNEVENVLWWNKSTERNILVSVTGVYWAQLQKGICSIIDTVNVNVVHPLQQNLFRDSSLCIGDTLLVSALSPFAKYHWNNGSENEEIVVTNAGIYKVDIQNACNSATHEVNITYRSECCQISYPNVFTPNDDTYNDLFEISTESSLTDFNLQIFNRWGKLVFSSTDIDDFWNGTDQQREIATGVYFLIANIRCNHKNEELTNTYRGQVMVLK